jgi:hypothetical protein
LKTLKSTGTTDQATGTGAGAGGGAQAAGGSISINYQETQNSRSKKEWGESGEGDFLGGKARPSGCVVSVEVGRKKPRGRRHRIADESELVHRFGAAAAAGGGCEFAFGFLRFLDGSTSWRGQRPPLILPPLAEYDA